MSAPWDDCKVAFGVEGESTVESMWYDNSMLPPGWSLDETDTSGARVVAVFRVEGRLTQKDGEAVERLLRSLEE